MKFAIFSIIVCVTISQVYACASNEWEPPGGGCGACPSSNYCNGTHSFNCPTVDKWGTHNEWPQEPSALPYIQCNICPPGQFEDPNDDCMTCTDSDGLICYPCGLTTGTYCPVDANEIPISNVAQPCSNGTYTNTTNVAQCTPCDPGYIAPEGKNVCTVCADGTYPTSSNDACQNCVYGSVCLNGIMSVCPDGWFSSDGINCGPCPDGKSWTDGSCHDHIIYDICQYDISNPPGPGQCKTICFVDPGRTQPDLCTIAPNRYDYDKLIPKWIQGFFWTGIVIFFGFTMII